MSSNKLKINTSSGVESYVNNPLEEEKEDIQKKIRFILSLLEDTNNRPQLTTDKGKSNLYSFRFHNTDYKIETQKIEGEELIINNIKSVFSMEKDYNIIQVFIHDKKLHIVYRR